MATVIRAEISRKNKYWINKHRYYELKHFCLQYPIWKQKRDLVYASMIERTAIEADPYLHNYIIKGVTEGRSYIYLRTVLGIPCGKDMYYDRYRKFFWLLSESRERGVTYDATKTIRQQSI